MKQCKAINKVNGQQCKLEAIICGYCLIHFDVAKVRKEE